MGKVECIILKHTNELGKGVNHRASTAQFRRVIEVWQSKIANLSGIHLLDGLQLGIHLLANLIILFQSHEVLEATTLWNFQTEAWLTCFV